MNPAYFRMLHHSTPSSGSPSRPSSPHRRLVQPMSSSTGGVTGSSSGNAGDSSPGISPSAFSQNYFKTFFVEEGQLGKGGKGVVLLVKHVLDGVALGHFACKRIPVGDDHQWLEKVLEEVQLLQDLSHPNLVSYRHVWLEDYQITSFGPSVPCAFILQQYCNAGDLRNYILGSVQTTTTPQQLKERMRRRSKHQPEQPVDLGGPRRMPFGEIFDFFKDITSGLNHLHAHGYIHRDLKPSNCLLHNDGRRIKVLVSDFGEVQAENAKRKATGATGTISYCAPEVLCRQPDGSLANFTTKSDIFSLGMIVYFICFGGLPYNNSDDINEENEDLDELRKEISAWPGFDDSRKTRDDLPDKLYKFLKRLLALDAKERPSTEDILLAIRTGDLDEIGYPHSRFFEDSRSRITSFDSPMSRGRNPPDDSDIPGDSRHRHHHHGNHRNLSPAATGRRSTPPSPSKRRHSILRFPTVTNDDSEPIPLNRSAEDEYSPPRQNSSVIIRPRVSLSATPPPSRHVTPEPQKERLMLPPPPATPTSLQSYVLQPLSIVIPVLGAFLVKLLSLSQPCSPFAANPWVSYPLMCLAALDLAFFGMGAGHRTSLGTIKLSLLGLLVHLLFVWAALKAGRLCEGKVAEWSEKLQH